MSADFLDIDDEAQDLPSVVEQLSQGIVEFSSAWENLTDKQKTFLETWRAVGYSVPDAYRALGQSPTNASTEFRWRANEHYVFCKKMLQKIGLDEAHDKAHQVTSIERLAVKAEAGKTLYYQGVPVLDSLTGKPVKEADVGAALRARELALKTGGHLKEEDRAGSFVLPQLVVQVTNRVGGEVEQTITVGAIPPVPELLPLWLDDGS